MEFLHSPEPWHWWTLAAIFIAIEIVATSFYLLWPGIAAALVGCLLWLFPELAFSTQIIVFSVVSVVSTFLWKRYMPHTEAEASVSSTLNQRSAQYVGRHCRALDDFTGGRGSVQIDDTRWQAQTADGSNPVAGTELQVGAADGTTLIVQNVD